MEENYFKQLYSVDVNAKKKNKAGLNYLSWAAAWAEVKKLFPTATFKIYEQLIKFQEVHSGDDERVISREVLRPWFDDGKTGWVKTGVTINGIEHIEELPIMNLKNKPIEAGEITSLDANKAIQRSLTKACARHGLGLYIYEDEDLPEESKELEKLRTDCMELIKKRSGLSDKTKEKVAEICKEVLMDENGDPRICEDNERLETLKKKLMATRKIV